MNSIVSEKGQVTIPKKLRDRLGIRPGDELDFEDSGGRLTARKVEHKHPVDRVYGILRGGAPTDALIEAMRGKPDGL